MATAAGNSFWLDPLCCPKMVKMIEVKKSLNCLSVSHNAMHCNALFETNKKALQNNIH